MEKLLKIFKGVKMQIIINSKSNFIRVIFFILFVYLACSCTKEKKDPPKSMEQLRKEQGVPVVVKTIDYTNFEKELTFICRLSGIQEATVSSMMGDNVLKVRAKLGDNVKQGQVVMEFPTSNPTVQFTQAKVALENAEKMYKRMKELVQAGETSQLNYDNVETQYLVAKRNWEAVRQMVYVESPISGKIINLAVKEGERVDFGKPLFTVAQINKMKAKFWVSESEIGYLKLGMPASISIGGIEFTGKITELGLAIDKNTRAFGVEVQFDNSKGLLKSGMTTELKVRIYNNPKAIVVPINLVQRSNGNAFVYVVENNKAVQREVKLGQQSDVDYEILAGLNAGEQLVIEGQGLLQDGVKVAVK